MAIRSQPQWNQQDVYYCSNRLPDSRSTGAQHQRLTEWRVWFKLRLFIYRNKFKTINQIGYHTYYLALFPPSDPVVSPIMASKVSRLRFAGLTLLDLTGFSCLLTMLLHFFSSTAFIFFAVHVCFHIFPSHLCFSVYWSRLCPSFVVWLLEPYVIVLLISPLFLDAFSIFFLGVFSFFTLIGEMSSFLCSNTAPSSAELLSLVLSVISWSIANDSLLFLSVSMSFSISVPKSPEIYEMLHLSSYKATYSAFCASIEACYFILFCSLRANSSSSRFYSIIASSFYFLASIVC